MSDEGTAAKETRWGTPRRVDGSSQVWYRRRAVLVAAAVVAILAVTIITDLPAPDNRASDISAAKSVLAEVDTDLAPCENATSEAFELWGFRTAGTITGYERANASQWVNQDIDACSLANAQIFDLTSNIDVSGTPSGKQLNNMLNWVTQWSTSDALDAMNAIAQLMADPTDAKELAALQAQWSLMVVHRLDADRCVQAASALLATSLPGPGLPEVPRPAMTLSQN